MRTTNAVIDYINRKIAKEVPEPSSVEEYTILQDKAKELENKYFKEMHDFSNTLIESMKKAFPELKEATFNPSRYAGLSINTANTSAAKQAKEDRMARTEYLGDVVARVLAGLSTIKDMDALDIFIANTIERMSK